MIVQDRIGGFQEDRPLKSFRRVVILAKLEVSPPQAVDYIAIIWLELDGPAKHFEGFLKGRPWSTHEYPR